jgi:hypothetical protein
LSVDLSLLAEAFARLVHGPLDSDHTPPGPHGPALDILRNVFPEPWRLQPQLSSAGGPGAQRSRDTGRPARDVGDGDVRGEVA